MGIHLKDVVRARLPRAGSRSYLLPGGRDLHGTGVKAESAIYSSGSAVIERWWLFEIFAYLKFLAKRVISII